MLALTFVVAVAVGMIDPIVAAIGIISGLLWSRNRVWAAVLFGIGCSIIIAIPLLHASAFQDSSERAVFHSLTSICAAGIWAFVVVLPGRLASNRKSVDLVAMDVHSVREMTVQGVVLGILITLVFTAANVYLGLKVGLTFATSIPAAVISMAVLSAFRDSSIQ